jgi:hypothetical protein
MICPDRVLDVKYITEDLLSFNEENFLPSNLSMFEFKSEEESDYVDFEMVESPVVETEESESEGAIVTTYRYSPPSTEEPEMQQKQIVWVDEAMDDEEFQTKLKEMYPKLRGFTDLEKMNGLRAKTMSVLQSGICELEKKISQAMIAAPFFLIEEYTYKLRVVAEEKMESFIRELLEREPVVATKFRTPKKNQARNRHRPPWVNNILLEWLKNNLKHPYPSNEVKQDLANRTNLTVKQVTTWMTNKRIREIKASKKDTSEPPRKKARKQTRYESSEEEYSGDSTDDE